MSRIEVHLLDSLRCVATHAESGARIRTHVAPELGGGGTAFSSTDLVAAALGTCIGSSLAPILQREGIGLDGLRIEVGKELSLRPRRIAALTVTILCPVTLTRDQRTKLKRAARSCAVHRSLHPEVRMEVTLVDPEGGPTGG